jgi:hypothetical protein
MRAVEQSVSDEKAVFGTIDEKSGGQNGVMRSLQRAFS